METKVKIIRDMTCVFNKFLWQDIENIFDENSSGGEVSTFKDMSSLLANWVFMMFAVSNFLTSLGYPIPYTFIPVRLEQGQTPKRCGRWELLYVAKDLTKLLEGLQIEHCPYDD